MKLLVSRDGDTMIAQLLPPDDLGPEDHVDAPPQSVNAGDDYYGVTYNQLKRAGPGIHEFPDPEE